MGAVDLTKPRKKFVHIDWENGKSYVFVGSIYFRYDNSTDHAEGGYPIAITKYWPGLWADGIDAGFCVNSSYAYFFRGNQCIKYDKAGDRACAGYPKNIQEDWPGLNWTSIDTAFKIASGEIYFFKGSQYIRYNLSKLYVDSGYPKPISNWFRQIWEDGVDCVATWERLPNKLYFYKGENYYRYDRTRDSADDGYPIRTDEGWHGIPSLSSL